ncbi:MAG: hypothetical protein IKB88_10550 [Clostridia bacterium]|nr:hypothetical protein [Clostridia bacterium]
MKFFRMYIITALAVVSITSVAAGIVAVDESAKRISLGETQSVCAYGRDVKVHQPADVTDLEPYFMKARDFIIELSETRNIFISEK